MGSGAGTISRLTGEQDTNMGRSVRKKCSMMMLRSFEIKFSKKPVRRPGDDCPQSHGTTLLSRRFWLRYLPFPIGRLGVVLVCHRLVARRTYKRARTEQRNDTVRFSPLALCSNFSRSKNDQGSKLILSLLFLNTF